MKTIDLIKRAAGLALAALIIFSWFWLTPDGWLGKANAIGFAVCHQLSAHSFFIHDAQPMPMCARCSGMYIAVMITLSYTFFVHPKKGGFPPKEIMALFAVIAFLWLVDGVNSFLHLFPFWVGLYTPQNLLRLLTGSGMGVIAASFLYAAFNQTVWIDWDKASPFTQKRNVIVLLMIVLGGVLLILTEQPRLLYPLAILSAVGVIILLSLIYGIIWIMVIKRSNTYNRWSQLIAPLFVGAGLAFLQIGLLDWIRYYLSGGWQGLPLP